MSAPVLARVAFTTLIGSDEIRYVDRQTHGRGHQHLRSPQRFHADGLQRGHSRRRVMPYSAAEMKALRREPLTSDACRGGQKLYSLSELIIRAGGAE